MCEIILIYFLQQQLGEMIERKGHDSILIRVLFVVSWFVCEIGGATMGFVVHGGQFGPAVLAGAVGGIIFVCAIFFFIAAMFPEAKRERGYMDDYHEYRRSGRIKKRRRYEEDEDEDRVRRRDDFEEDRPRRRPREEEDDRPPRRPRYADEDDRPRRRPAPRDEDDRPRRRPAPRDEDDRPPRRRDDRFVRDDEDDRPRPRRRPRPDEDY
jgi:hypothetical protein